MLCGGIPSLSVLCKVFYLGGLSQDLGLENGEKSCFMGLEVGKVFEDSGLGCRERRGLGGNLDSWGLRRVGLSSFGVMVLPTRWGC